MGCLRLYVALLIAFNHGIYLGYLPASFLGYSFAPLNLRVFFFFMLSGFMIACLLREKWRRGKYWACRFYLSRAARLMPMYYLALLLTLGFVWHYGEGPALATGFTFDPSVAENDGWAWWYNLTLLMPQTLALFDLGEPAFLRVLVVSQCWSLAQEWWFLLLAPLLAAAPVAALSAFLLSLGYWVAYFPDYAMKEGYAVFCLGFFSAGMLTYHGYARFLRHRPSSLSFRMAAAVLTAALAIYLFSLRDILHAAGRIPALAMFVPLALAAIISLFHTARDLSWDRRIGDLSYPLFLIHPAVWAWLHHQGLSQMATGVIGTGVCLAGAALMLQVDRPISRWRRRLTSMENAV